MSTRVPVIAGNWKLNKTAAETTAFLEAVKPLVAGATHCEMVVCPPFLSVPAAVAAADGSSIQVGAQNLYWEDSGAYTGEISGPMVKASGASHVIIGHSERRQYFGETDATVAKRINAALAAELTPIVCVGELKEEREAEKTNDVLATQFAGAFDALTGSEFDRIIIAYEPVWAIGTGLTATPEIAGEAHAFLRARAEEKFGSASAEGVRILYGGSVKPGNVAGLMARPEIDGGLVGGASLDPESYAKLVDFPNA